VECGSRLARGLHTSAAWTANLQVFCREKSGKGCPVSVCLFPSLVRGACGHACRASLAKSAPQKHRLLSMGPWSIENRPRAKLPANPCHSILSGRKGL
jgi:hypothetical protein